MIAHDRGWLRRLREAVSSGLTAEAAVERVQNDARAKLQRQTDPYLRDRLHDLDDLANRLLHQLAGQSLVAAAEELPDNAILVARSMGPAALLDYDRARLRGLVLEEAGASSHVAIVARALGIPAVGDVANISELVEHGDAIIVDGVTGEVQVRPQPDVEAAYRREGAAARAPAGAVPARCATRRRVTRDGVAIGLHMNAGLVVDLPHLDGDRRAIDRPVPHRTAVHAGAALSAALARSRRSTHAVLDAAGDRPVTFRTLDIGGDKVLPYMKALEEENPALGWRAIRIGLDQPALLRTQIARHAARRRRARVCASCCRWWRASTNSRAARALLRARAGLRRRERPPAAGDLEARRDGRGALAALAARRDRRARRFPVGRLQRPDAISVRRRPRQQARRATASIRLSAGFLRALKAIADVGRAPWQAGRRSAAKSAASRSRRWR